MIASVGSDPGPETEHEPATSEMVEQHGTLGDHVRVVVRHADDAGAQLDVASALRRGGDEDLRAGDDLAAGGVMLADPGLVVTELVEVHDQIEVALQRQRRVLDRQGGTEP